MQVEGGRRCRVMIDLRTAFIGRALREGCKEYDFSGRNCQQSRAIIHRVHALGLINANRCGTCIYKRNCGILPPCLSGRGRPGPVQLAAIGRSSQPVPTSSPHAAIISFGNAALRDPLPQRYGPTLAGLVVKGAASVFRHSYFKLFSSRSASLALRFAAAAGR